DLGEEIQSWCGGRSAAVRAPLLLWMACLGVRHLAASDYNSVVGALNLGVHEGGHLVFSWLGWNFLTVAGGTLLQLSAPLAAAWMSPGNRTGLRSPSAEPGWPRTCMAWPPMSRTPGRWICPW